MQKEVSLQVSPEKMSPGWIKKRLASETGVGLARITGFRLVRRSIDARKKKIVFNIKVQAFIDEPFQPVKKKSIPYQNVSNAQPVIIVGSGPAGLFCALKLIELGLKPLIFERGKPVNERKVDIANISRQHVIDPDSNYCFGEGGAGTFSDGKLYTRSKKRGKIMDVLECFHYHGANDNILYEAHPHLGTDKLPGIIKSMRETIKGHGGEFFFKKRITGLMVKNNQVEGVEIQGGDRVNARAVVLATGHSARDIYQMLVNAGIMTEQKTFALGVRVEHPREIIDQIQYHGYKNMDLLPTASYSLVQQVNGRGVFSFCMCPGGFIVPSATENDEVVVNGMSPSQRNSPYSNAGIVVEVRPGDLFNSPFKGPMAGIMFQKELEKQAYLHAGKCQKAPSQRLTDFIEGNFSGTLPACSYFPGVVGTDFNQWLPAMINDRLKEAFISFGRKMKGFVTSEAIITGVESRSSSPVRIPRDKDTLQHVGLQGLFPCGEGAGYAGGITSSAIDGERVAQACKILLG